MKKMLCVLAVLLLLIPAAHGEELASDDYIAENLQVFVDGMKETLKEYTPMQIKVIYLACQDLLGIKIENETFETGVTVPQGLYEVGNLIPPGNYKIVVGDATLARIGVSTVLGDYDYYYFGPSNGENTMIITLKKGQKLDVYGASVTLTIFHGF